LAAGYASDGGAVVKAMAKLAQRDSDDKWFRAGILTSVPQKAEQWALLESLTTEPLKGAGEEDFLRDLSRTMNDPSVAGGSSPGDNLGRMLQISAHGGYGVQAALLLGLADRDQLDGAAKTSVHASDDLRRVLTEAQRIATDPKAAIDERTKAITLLGATDVLPNSADTLRSLISSDQPQDVAAAAARAIAHPRHIEALPAVLSAERWQKYPPMLRAAVLSSIIGHPMLAKPLLDAIESGAVPAGMLMPNQKEWLEKLKDDQQRARAEKLFAGGGLAKDRMKVYEETKAQVMALTGHPAHGQKVFRDNCTTCHRLDREGVAVGPDLLDIRSQPKESILLHIVIPEYEIAPNFTCYNCVTKDGRTISGIMVAETPAAVTLREPLAVEETIQRDQIQSIEASKLSLMPQGLEKVIQPQDMADLLAYLRGEK
jgi:putative heme-binding domain-containing protein